MSDLYDTYEDEVEQEAPKPDTDSEFKRLRTDRNKLEKELKALTPELEELRQFKAEYDKQQRTSSVAKVFEDLGLAPNVSKFWNLENPEADPTPETVGRWAVENGFAQASEEAPEPIQGFVPTTTPEGTPLQSKRLTRDEWLNLSISDPAAAEAALKKGRVDLSDVRVGLGPDK